MPWDCSECGQHVGDDETQSCPGCQHQKSTWTVVPDRTRTLVVKGHRFQCLRGRVSETTSAVDPLYDAMGLDETRIARVLSKASALKLAEQQRQPASFDLLVVRLIPRAVSAEVVLGIDYARQDLDEQTHPAPSDPFVDVPFLFVAGPEALPLGFGFNGLRVVDVTESTDLGFAPGIEVTALKCPTVELTSEAVDPDEPDSPRVVAVGSLPGVTFATDSAFVRPSVVEELKALESLARAHPTAKISIFGHADAVGDELYNKKLSERRAWSVYAFVVDDAEAWETLYQHGDEAWGAPVLSQILSDLGHEGALEVAMRSFRGLPDGAPVSNDAAFRTELFAAYMSDKKRGIDLPRSRFLEPGYMGCGEYNLLEAASGASDTNRRVTFVFFDPDQVPVFPCAFADIAPCQQQLAAPGERNRETFRCAFFDEHAREISTPTNDDDPDAVVLRFYRADGTFIPNASWCLYGPSGEERGSADAQGVSLLSADLGQGRYTITWHDPKVELFDHDHHYGCEVHFGIVPESLNPDCSLRRLHNLGYHDDHSLEARTERFQRDYQEQAKTHGLALTPTGALDTPTIEMVRRAHNTCTDDLRVVCPTQVEA